MGIHEYQALCKEVYRAVLGQLERPTEEKYRFLQRDTSPAILHDKILNRFFASIQSEAVPVPATKQSHAHAILDGESPSASPGSASTPLQTASEKTLATVSAISSEEKIVRMKKRALHDLLAVILFSTCDISAARAFERRLILIEDLEWESINSKRKTGQRELGALPLSTQDVEAIFGKDVDSIPERDRILEKQTYFHPVVLRKGREVKLSHQDSRRFPYLEEKEIGAGSFGTVYKVKIAKGHFRDENGEPNNEPIELARKDYRRGERRRTREEMSIMTMLSKFKDHPNIVKSLAALENGPDTYSMFLELASCDLSTYLNSHVGKPTSAQAKANLLLSAAELTNGLSFLHQGLALPDMYKELECVCYHMDLKPNNILVFPDLKETQNGLEERLVWKLSDFGHAVIKTKEDAKGNSENRGRLKWFANRKGNGASFSGTQNRRLQGTYLAPESETNERNMGRHSDLWSFGCIISVLFTFLEMGPQGIDEYSDRRVGDRDTSDQFFRPALYWKNCQLNPEVKAWHARLVRAAEFRDLDFPGSKEGAAVHNLLRFLEEEVLVPDWTRRKKTDAENVENELRRIAKFYEGMANDNLAFVPTASVSRGRRAVNFVTSPFISRRGSRPISIAEEVNHWRIPDAAPIKATTITPCGRAVGFWSDRQLRLYTPAMMNRVSSGSVVDSYGERSTLDRNVLWISVKMTYRYLVASTNRNNFDCHIFHLDNPGLTNVSLEQKRRLYLQEPEIRRVAISPDNKWFVCILANKDGMALPGTMRVVAFDKVLKASKEHTNTVAADVLMAGPDGNADIPWEIIPLGSPAADVAHLTFSGTVVYAVVRPYLEAHDSEHRIVLHSYDIMTGAFNTINIKTTPVEYSTVSFFTTFAPFRTQNACAIVTRESRLQIQYFEKLDTEEDYTKDVVVAVENYRLIRLMLDFDDTNIYALGTETANHVVWLLKFAVPDPQNPTIKVRKVHKLQDIWYNDDARLNLSKADDATHILVSSARGVIYRHTFDEHQREEQRRDEQLRDEHWRDDTRRDALRGYETYEQYRISQRKDLHFHSIPEWHGH